MFYIFHSTLITHREQCLVVSSVRLVSVSGLNRHFTISFSYIFIGIFVLALILMTFHFQFWPAAPWSISTHNDWNSV